MKKTILFTTALLAPLLFACNPSTSSGGNLEESSSLSSEVLSPIAVKKVNFLNGVFYFTPTNGDTYLIKIIKGENVLLEREVSTGYLNVSSLTLGGDINVEVTTILNGEKSEPVSTIFSFFSYFDSLCLEAENGVLNEIHKRDNPLASGSSYVGGIDAAGQGVTFNFFSCLEGTFPIDCYYTTGAPGSEDFIFVNGIKEGKFVFLENTGWGSASSYNSKVASSEITLKKGWNTLSVIKDGTSENNYGGWAELDKFLIKGNGEKYDPTETSGLDSLVKDSYRLEAEQACHLLRNKVDNDKSKWVGQNKAPKKAGSASNGFLMADLNEIGEALEWKFIAPKTGEYTFNLSFAHSYEAGVSKVDYYQSKTSLKNVSISQSDLLMKGHQVLGLDKGQGWENPNINGTSLTITLDEGVNYLYCVRENECWYQLDYAEVTAVKENN